MKSKRWRFIFFRTPTGWWFFEIQLASWFGKRCKSVWLVCGVLCVIYKWKQINNHCNRIVFFPSAAISSCSFLKVCWDDIFSNDVFLKKIVGSCWWCRLPGGWHHNMNWLCRFFYPHVHQCRMLRWLNRLNTKLSLGSWHCVLIFQLGRF